ncbi:MAG: Spy/CpxP family protein refolding chaperone [Bacteroidales bacterium]|nr:Spy/CpxP family protein refolding chaperone [Bacteroidales bacterium]
MKTQVKNLAGMLLIMAILVTSLSAFSQPGMRGNRNLDNDRPGTARIDQDHPFFDSLSDDQKAKIKTIQLNHQKEMIQLKNQLREKKARLISLQTMDSPNVKEIDAQIDAIGALKVQIAKKRSQVHLSIRELLTEEQRILFDSRLASGKGMKNGKGIKNGRGNKGRMGRNQDFEDRPCMMLED